MSFGRWFNDRVDAMLKRVHGDNGGLRFWCLHLRDLEEGPHKQQHPEEETNQILKETNQLLKGTYQILKETYQILQGTYQILKGTYQIPKETNQIL